MRPDKEECIVDETEDYIDVCVGVSEWQVSNGLYILEEDYRIQGEVWRVHKKDVDPFPSRPHAHCIDGAKRFIGCTLHLGSRELFNKQERTGRLLAKKQFNRLIELIQPKFLDVNLPLNE